MYHELNTLHPILSASRQYTYFEVFLSEGHIWVNCVFFHSILGYLQLKRANSPVMPGDSYSSRRLFSLVFAGTIPVSASFRFPHGSLLRFDLNMAKVIICDHCILPYHNLIDYTKFCVFLSEKQILTDPSYDIFEILESIPNDRIAQLEHYGRLARRHFTYQQGKPLPGDAFDLLVSQILSQGLFISPANVAFDMES